MNNKKMNVVGEILKIRGGDQVCVREDLQGASFNNMNVPLLADIKGILRSFFTNADDIICNMSFFGYFGVSAIYLNEAVWRNKIDKHLLLMSIKATDEPKVLNLIKNFK
jgi:hypothetical protein